MTHRMRLAGTAALLVACGATSSVAQPRLQSASPALTASIREAVSRARVEAAGDREETTVVASVADVIVTANASPVQALASVRLAIAEEGCVFKAEAWNRWGCAGLASVAVSIEQAVGSGPAASLGEGGVATSAPPPPPGGGGADYRAPIGG